VFIVCGFVVICCTFFNVNNGIFSEFIVVLAVICELINMGLVVIKILIVHFLKMNN